MNPMNLLGSTSNAVSGLSNVVSTGAFGDAASSGAAGAMTGSINDTLGNLGNALEQGIASQASMAALQTKASTQQAKIAMEQQSANSALHMAQQAMSAAVKLQNAGADAAKEAAG